MNKHWILFYLPKPGVPDGDADRLWSNLSSHIPKSVLYPKDTVQIGPCSWLITRDSAIPFVAECISILNKSLPTLEYKVIYLKDDD